VKTMKSSRIKTALMLAAFMTGLAGCVGYVSTPPPAARVEVLPVIPFAGAVWVGGHYEHRHRGYVWLPGRYVKPPHRGAHWVPGHWQNHRRGWRWHKGYWK
jgi:hypothetical protein